MANLEIDDTPRPVDPIPPGISHRYANLNGTRYRIVQYLITPRENYADRCEDCLYGDSATGKCLGTVILVHGFQDTSFGWRYQMPALQRQGFQVIAIDCIGYGGTVPSILSSREY